MSGGSITGNNNNGVYVSDSANTTFTVSGAPTVTGNTRNSAASNVFLAGSQTITIGEAGLTSGASIGVIRGAYLFIANNVNEDYSGNFSSDNTQYVVKYDKPNSQLVLAKVKTPTPEHIHTYGDWSKDGTYHWHKCTDANCPNPSESIEEMAKHVYDDGADATCNVCGYKRTVTTENIPVTKITLNTTTTALKVGETTTLTATVKPDNATKKDVTWTSSNEKVATVTANGTVKALAVGTTKIIATAVGGTDKSATCKVTVTGGTTPSQPGGSTGGSSGGDGGGGAAIIMVAGAAVAGVVGYGVYNYVSGQKLQALLPEGAE